jgi:tripartite-type tricarboxylate transporter receptor subunit TctC
MLYITRLLFGIILLYSASALAEEFQLLIPFPAGNQTDIVGRMLQASVERNTNDRIIINNMPGAETIIGATHFKNNKNIDIIMGSGSQIIFNPLLKENLSYSDSDFNHIIYIGTSVGLWVTRPDTKLKTPQDLVTYMPDFVGGYSHSYNFNVNALVKEKSIHPVTIVQYKGSNDIIVDLMNGSLDLAVMALNSNLIQLVKTGKLHIVGNTYNQDVTVDGIFIPAANKKLGISQFNGFLSLEIQPGISVERSDKLQKLLWEAVKDPIVSQGLKNLYLLPDATNDTKYINSYYKTQRTKVKNFLTK